MTATQVANKALRNLGAPLTITDLDTDTTKEAVYCREALDNCRKSLLQSFTWNFAIKRATLSGAAISSCADNGAGLIRVEFATDQTFVDNDLVVISGVLGTSEANGKWTLNKITAKLFDLQGSAFVNAYVSGGTMWYYPSFGWEHAFIKPSDCLRLIDVDNGAEFEVEGDRVMSNEDSLNIRYLHDVTDYSKYSPLALEALAAFLGWAVCYAITQSRELTELMWAEYDKLVKKARYCDSVEGPQRALSTDGYETARKLGPRVREF